MTDYLWEKEECQQQYDDTISYKLTKEEFFKPKNRAKRERDRRKKVYTYIFFLNLTIIYIVFRS